MNGMNQKSKVISVVLLAIWCFLLLTNCSQAISPEELQKIESAVPPRATVTPKRPRKLLVFSLCQGYKHSSIPYGSKAFEIMGKKTGAFDVVVSDDMAMFDADKLNQFDAVLFNNSTRLSFKDPVLRQSLMDFVKGGKGVVGVHAATDNFYDWPEAAEMMGGLFDGHPWNANETVAVKIDDTAHPLCTVFKGKGFEIKDEIYQFKVPYSREKLRVLLSLDTSKTNVNKGSKIKRTDNDFAVSWVRSYGKGRVFYCSLGHNHHIFWNPAVLKHYLDGIQFALGDLSANTTPSTLDFQALENILTGIAAYEYGQSRAALTLLTDFIRLAYDSPQSLKQIERRLLEFLRTDATLAGKQFICRKLSIIGTEEAVSTLAAMLTKTATSDMARYALERIPGSAVDKALRNALGKTSGKVKVGIINSLGERGDREAVRQLSKLLSDADKEIARAAISALGRIGGKKAAKVLGKAKSEVEAQLHLPWADAYLMCADGFLTEGDMKSAMKIYKQMYVTGEPAPIRIAALRGRVSSAKEEAVGIIVDILKGDEPDIQAAAIGLVSEIPETQEIGAVAAELSNLPAAGQVQLLSALADRGDPAILPVVVSATKRTEDSVRIAALSALAVLGDASTVDLLAQAAAVTKGAERQTARESLYRLRSAKVDQTILASIPQADPEVKVELIRSVGRRNVYAAVGALLKTAQDPDSNVRLESIKVLRDIAGTKDVSALVDLLIRVKGEAELREAERTVAAVAHKIPQENRRAEAVLAVLPSVKEITARCSLLSVLGKIGDDSALPTLRAALNDKDVKVREAAIRGLSNWPTAEPRADLLKVAQTSDNEIHRVLALRGFVRLIGLDRGCPADEMIKMYQEAMGLAPDVSGKNMVLSGLANVKSFAALQMAAGYLEDEALQREAGAAMIKIAQTTRSSHPQQTKILLRMIIQVSKSAPLRKQAQEIIDQIK